MSSDNKVFYTTWFSTQLSGISTSWSQSSSSTTASGSSSSSSGKSANRAPSARCDVLESHDGLLQHLIALGGGGGGGGRAAAEQWFHSHGIGRLLVVHPGNPGIPHFYDDFVAHLIQQDKEEEVNKGSNQRLAVIVLGFAGHSIIPKQAFKADDASKLGKTQAGDEHERALNAEIDDERRVFLLQDQVEIAFDFYRTVVFRSHLHSQGGEQQQRYGLKVFSSGHSIGAYIALQMTARFPSAPSAASSSSLPSASLHSSSSSSSSSLSRAPTISRVFLLTPTVMGMAECPNGRPMKRVFDSSLLVWILSHVVVGVILRYVMPSFILRFLLAKRNDPPLNLRHQRVAYEIAVSPRNIENILLLGGSELNEVNTLDVHMLHAADADDHHARRRDNVLGSDDVHRARDENGQQHSKQKEENHHQLGSCGRIRGYYVKSDGWVPLHQKAAVDRHLSAGSTYLDPDASVLHAWCCTHSERVAQFVTDNMK